MSNTNRNQDKLKSKFSITVTSEEFDIANISESLNELQESRTSLSATYRPNSSYPETYKPKRRVRVTPREINKCVSKSFEDEVQTLPPVSVSKLNKSAVIPSEVCEAIRKEKNLKRKKNSCTASCLII